MQIKSLNHGYDTVEKIIKPYILYDASRCGFCVFATAKKDNGVSYTVILKMFQSKKNAQKYLDKLAKKLGAEVIENG